MVKRTKETKVQKKARQAKKCKCTDCGATMRASKIGDKWLFMCTVDSYHKKRNGTGYGGINPDAMNYRVPGSFGTGKHK